MKFLVGAIALGIVVFSHEMGHFVAARVLGVCVDAFSVGLGPVLFRKKIGATEWRISAIPIGGYCAMKGEGDLRDAIERGLPEVKGERGSFYGASPARRAAIAFAGPFANIVFAFLALLIAQTAGFVTYTSPSKIIVASDFDERSSCAARDAGLLTGDVILSIDGKKTPYFSDVFSAVCQKAQQEVKIEILRDGRQLSLKVRPTLDKSSGAGRLGVYSWVDPVISEVQENSAAAAAGLLAGDKILSADGCPVSNTVALSFALEGKKSAELGFLRGGEERLAAVPLEIFGGRLGAAFALVAVENPKFGFFGTIAHCAKQTAKSLFDTVKGLAILFKGIDLSQAVSGPVRITAMLGDIAKEGFSEGISAGVSSCAAFLAAISLSLCVMNLLPIPVLDGSLIVFSLAELIRRRQINPKSMERIQLVGVFLLAALFILTAFCDVKFLFKRT